jgi:hypothetical protein
MTARPDRLYDLLPAVYRLRDAVGGEPLRALLQVIGEQVDVVQASLDRLPEQFFIETCDDWIVPYIGDLVDESCTLVLNARSGDVASAEAHRRLRAASPRRQVADAIRRRRRKGTPAVLEEVVSDLAGWPAHVVESFRLLLYCQSVNHLHTRRGRTLDFARVAELERLGGPFERAARTVDVRRIDYGRSRSRWNIPEVAVFAWRLRPMSRTQSEAFCIDRARNRYTFSVLGNDAPLMAGATSGPEGARIAAEEDVPDFVTRRALHERGPELYGRGRSLCISRDDRTTAVPVDDVVAADLSAWAYRPMPGEVAVDPELGRIAFSSRNSPDMGVWVTFNEGLPDEIGGGEYARNPSPVGDRRPYAVGPGGHNSLMEAIAAFESDSAAGRTPDGAVIEITDGAVYQERVELTLRPGDRLELRAADGCRPVIRLLDLYANRPDQMRIRGVDEHAERAGPCAAPPPKLVLDGLLITGRSVEIVGTIGQVLIRDCTLVPGWSLDHDCRPAHESEPSIELVDTDATLLVQRSIVGAILVSDSDVTTDPIDICVADSVVDGTGVDRPAVSAPDGLHAHARLTVLRTTVIGQIMTYAVVLGEDAIFNGPVRVVRSQLGCMRYCHVPAGSRTPRRHRCQPDLSRAAASDRAAALGLSSSERDSLVADETLGIAPEFESLRYGTPTYARLALACPREISRGASDGGEMGVYHDLFQPQRVDAVTLALDDYTPAGMTVGLVFAT